MAGQALLFAACQNHTDVCLRVLEAVAENELEDSYDVDDEEDDDDEDGVRAAPAKSKKTAGVAGAAALSGAAKRKGKK